MRSIEHYEVTLHAYANPLLHTLSALALLSRSHRCLHFPTSQSMQYVVLNEGEIDPNIDILG